jgi:hypothetical protein
MYRNTEIFPYIMFQLKVNRYKHCQIEPESNLDQLAVAHFPCYVTYKGVSYEALAPACATHNISHVNCVTMPLLLVEQIGQSEGVKCSFSFLSK